MAGKRIHIALNVLTVAAIVGIVAILLLSEPKAAWNSGAREKLYDALNVLCVAIVNRDAGSHGLDPGDFIPRGAGSTTEPAICDGKKLAERHGVSVRWRRNRVYEKLLFYPIAVSEHLAIETRSDGEPTPLIVMVPVDEEDIETLPNLSGCRDVAVEEMWKCQFRRMEELFSKHGFDYAITLRSDGSVRALPVDDVLNRVPRTPVTDDSMKSHR